ncbi:hypothetical protein GALMADRAFT_282808 [Galerina marginata CBS 339.88]|uniref:Uncharacterized protein n=1 Tax=Galerina marginata (strain CBS 339.88) TaxID=685588 RepID=A0A067SDZ7_GALM3|nr:hypothetical protein GALMADRAFT_282808 [Galerina marginata CBS 339.88]
MSATALKSSTIDDRDANVTYVPDRWTVHTNVQSIFHLYGNTDTFSDIQNATATVKFYGNTIEYWGNTGPYHGPCIISLDGKEMTTVNSHADADGYPMLLYSKTDLALGDHVLQVKVANPSYPNVCEVDRFVANVTSGTGYGGGGNNGNGGTSNGGANGGSKKGPPIAIIAGAAGGGVLCILLLGILLYLRSKKKAARGRIDISKPLLIDGLPSSPPPQTTNFLQNHNRPVSYAPTASPPTSYEPSAAYISGSPPLGAGGSFNPYNSVTYEQGTHFSPAPSMGSVPLLAGTRTSVGPTSIMSSTTGIPSYYNPASEVGSSSGYVPSQYQQQPVSYVSNPDPSSPNAGQTQHKYPMPPGPENAKYEPRSEKAILAYAESSDALSGSGSGSGSGAAAPRRDVLSPDAGSELPPPAYDD